MESIDKRIIAFIKKHHVLTLATCEGGIPYTANLFYAYREESNELIVTSDPWTRHAREASANEQVALNIVLETRIVGKIEGLQGCGIFRKLENEALQEAKKAYIKRFPYAALADLTLWAIEPTYLKYTDNKLGFGKKLYWKNDEQ